MSERMNGRDYDVRRRHGVNVNERPGILASPSSDLLKRRQNANLQRQIYGKPITIESTTTYTLGDTLFSEIALPSCYSAQEAVGSVAVKEQVKIKNEKGLDSLPIDASETEIVDTIFNNRASIVIAETGSGKTTRIPQFLVNAGMDHVYVSEPRRATVDGPGARVQDELNIQFGVDGAEGMVETIHGGRAVRYEHSRISFATAASLIRMMPEVAARVEAGEKVAILIDEIHENDQYTEALTGVANMMASKHPEISIVCMSATIDENMLKVPLARVSNFDNPEKVDVPVMHIKGRPFTYTAHEVRDMNPAEVALAYFQDSRVPTLVSRGYEPMGLMKGIVDEGYEARETGSSLRLIHRSFSGKASSRKREEIVEIAQNLDEDKQLMLMATPAIQSGVTVPGLDYLAYDGMINRDVRRPDRGRGLVPSYASKAEIIQFFGRAGRDVPNAHVYLTSPMPSRRGEKAESEFKKAYPFKAMADRPDYPEPSIFAGNLAELLLLGVGAGAKPEEFNKFIINEQDRDTLREAVDRLYSEFNAIDEDDNITEIGKLMGRFPVAPELSRGIAEAVIKGRSKQHLAHMAIIASLIDTGGLQRDMIALEDARWRELLRSGSDDDFIAQFDFWDGFRRNEHLGTTSYEGFNYAVDFNLDYTKLLSAEEPIDKTMRHLGINPRTLNIEPPSYDDIRQIREDFTAGMYGLAYRETRDGKRADDKKHYFNPIVGQGAYPQRTLLKSSVLEPRKGEVVAGMPTFRPRIKDGNISEVEFLGCVLKTNHELIGKYALAGHRVEYIQVPGSARVNGGEVRESFQGVFGSLNVGSHVSDKVLRNTEAYSSEDIPLESRKRLIASIQAKPGPELQELRSVVATLSDYRRLLTPDIIAEYREKDAPVDITQGYIAKLLDDYAQRTRNAQEVDRLIGDHSYAKGLSVDLFYSTAAQQEMLARSPEYISLGPDVPPLRILYSEGRPYATNVTERQLATIDGPLFVDEGFAKRREVMNQIKNPQGRGTRRVSFGKPAES